MTEWLAFVLLTAVVLLVVVLLFGFTGCSLIVGGSDEDFEEAFTALFDKDRALPNRTIVVRIGANELLNSGTKVRIFLQQAGDLQLTIYNLYISKPEDPGDPDNYNAAGDLTAVVVQEEGLNVAGQTEVDVDYSLDADLPLLIAFETRAQSARLPFSNEPSRDLKVFLSPPPGQPPVPVHEASLAIRSVGYISESRNYLVSKIEVA